jgi:hypothetical protein
MPGVTRSGDPPELVLDADPGGVELFIHLAAYAAAARAFDSYQVALAVFAEARLPHGCDRVHDQLGDFFRVADQGQVTGVDLHRRGGHPPGHEPLKLG